MKFDEFYKNAWNLDNFKDIPLPEKKPAPAKKVEPKAEETKAE
jgi:hypothetical protein